MLGLSLRRLYLFPSINNVLTFLSQTLKGKKYTIRLSSSLGPISPNVRVIELGDTETQDANFMCMLISAAGYSPAPDRLRAASPTLPSGAGR